MNRKDAEADDDSGAVAKGVDRRAVWKVAVTVKEKIKEWVNPTENFVCVGSVTIFASDVIFI